MPTITKRAVIKILGGGGLAFVIIGLVWHWTMPRTLGDDAENILTAVENGNGEQLRPFLLDDEIRKLNLTPQRVSAILNEIVRPRLQRMNKVGPRQSEMAAGGAQALCIQKYETNTGVAFELIGSPMRSEHGGTTMLWPFIFCAWEIEFLVEPGIPKDTKSYAQAIIAGIDKDKAKLEAMGMPGRVIPPPGGGYQTWEEVREIMRERVRASP